VTYWIVLGHVTKPHRTPTYLYAAYCYRPSSLVCRWVFRSVTVVSSEKKRLNRSRCCLSYGLGWAEGSTCYTGVHIGAT